MTAPSDVERKWARWLQHKNKSEIIDLERTESVHQKRKSDIDLDRAGSVHQKRKPQIDLDAAESAHQSTGSMSSSSCMKRLAWNSISAMLAKDMRDQRSLPQLQIKLQEVNARLELIETDEEYSELTVQAEALVKKIREVSSLPHSSEQLETQLTEVRDLRKGQYVWTGAKHGENLQKHLSVQDPRTRRDLAAGHKPWLVYRKEKNRKCAAAHRQRLQEQNAQEKVHMETVDDCLSF